LRYRPIEDGNSTRESKRNSLHRRSLSGSNNIALVSAYYKAQRVLDLERLRRWRLFLFDLVGLLGVVASVYASCGGIEMISDSNNIALVSAYYKAQRVLDLESLAIGFDAVEQFALR
jgi:hypothetical protein